MEKPKVIIVLADGSVRLPTEQELAKVFVIRPAISAPADLVELGKMFKKRQPKDYWKPKFQRRKFEDG